MDLFADLLSNKDALITLGILFLAVCLFIRNSLAPELTGLLSVGLLIASGVLSPQKALAGFGSPSLITLMGLFAISAALFKSGALDRIREIIASESIRTPRRLIALLAFIVAPISGIIPNTPVVASLLPVLEAWCLKRKISPSKVLLPLSFATVLGGTLTLLGSSVNLLVSDIIQQLGYEPLELFSFTLIGLPIWLLGTLYMLVASDTLLPDRGGINNKYGVNSEMSGYFTEVTIPARSELVGQSLRNSRLQRRFDVDVLELHRNGKTILPPLADRKIEPDDRLILRVTRNDLLRLQQEHTIQLAEKDKALNNQNLIFPALDETESTKTIEALLPAGSTLAGASLRELRFRQRHNATVLALRRGQTTVQERLGQVILRAGDVLLLQAPLDSIRGLQSSNDLLVLDEFEDDIPTVRRKPIAVGIAILMILIPTITNLPLVASVLLAVIAMVAGGCLRPAEIQRSIRLDVLLLLGSLSSFSVAIQITGLGDLIAINLSSILDDLPIYFALQLIFVATIIITQFITNAASVALLLPVVLELAPNMNISPYALIMIVLFGASQSFLTPMGYQTNLMVFGPGRYKFFDFARYGGGLTILMIVFIPLLVLIQY
tara:strand:- start:5911 stop:7731 length:1821 start_codon:yes stop_codon:yes gene_type:complete